MSETRKHFVDQLLAADPPSSDARQRHEKEMRTMLEKRLTRYEGNEYLVVAILMGLLGLSMPIVYGFKVVIDGPLRTLPDKPELMFLMAFC